MKLASLSAATRQILRWFHIAHGARHCGLAALALLLTACTGGGSNPSTPAVPPPAVPAVADTSLLFMGNSHTLGHDVPGTVAALFRAARPGRTVVAVTAPDSLFLDERLNHAPTQALLNGRRWSAVILQAQKTSSSWTVEHPVAPAIDLVKQVRTQNAVPVLFPEWARRGVAESHLIYGVHTNIAKGAPACIAPIGQAWDLSLNRYSSLVLHESDGNHANAAGAFLAALMLFSTLTGDLPSTLPTLSSSSVDPTTQALLRGIATEAVQSVSPRLWCPTDPLL